MLFFINNLGKIQGYLCESILLACILIAFPSSVVLDITHFLGLFCAPEADLNFVHR